MWFRSSPRGLSASSVGNVVLRLEIFYGAVTLGRSAFQKISDSYKFLGGKESAAQISHFRRWRRKTRGKRGMETWVGVISWPNCHSSKEGYGGQCAVSVLLGYSLQAFDQ